MRVSFGGQRRCSSGDIIFSIYFVTLREHAFKGLCDFMGGRPSNYFTTLSSLLDKTT